MQKNKLKIALVHDYIKEFGGAEVVLEELSDIFPEAQIFTTLYRPQFFGPHRARLEKKWGNRIHQSFFNFIPFAHKLISPLRLLSPFAFKTFNFSTFDLVITSATGAYFPNALNKKTARLICYCHTPPRYLYGLATARDLSKHKIIWFFAQIANHFLRLFDFTYAQNVDQFIANSATTSTRIQKFCRRDSIVINPPVNIPSLPSIFKGGARGGFYLTGGRLAFAKHFDIAVVACTQLGVPLKVFGRDFANIESQLKKLAGSNIEFLGEITNEQRTHLMSQAKAFIFCSDNEDFGIVPVEAMALGCSVIAYKSGGVTETVVEGKTGVFFDNLTADSCAQAIKKLETLKIKSSDCITQSKKFSKKVFITKIKKLILL